MYIPKNVFTVLVLFKAYQLKSQVIKVILIENRKYIYIFFFVKNPPNFYKSQLIYVIKNTFQFSLISNRYSMFWFSPSSHPLLLQMLSCSSLGFSTASAWRRLRRGASCGPRCCGSRWSAASSCQWTLKAVICLFASNWASSCIKARYHHRSSHSVSPEKSTSNLWIFLWFSFFPTLFP